MNKSLRNMRLVNSRKLFDLHRLTLRVVYAAAGCSRAGMPECLPACVSFGSAVAEEISILGP